MRANPWLPQSSIARYQNRLYFIEIIHAIRNTHAHFVSDWSQQKYNLVSITGTML